MKEKEETRKRLAYKIFESCKRENRNPDNAEISIFLSQFEEEIFFEKINKNLYETKVGKGTIVVTQKLSDLNGIKGAEND